MGEHSEWLVRFVTESNRIEGILREPTRAELAAHWHFVKLGQIEVADVAALVSVCAPGHVLRDRPGLNVRVGNHIAPEGGPQIREQLASLLRRAASPHENHIAYEFLHPFTDGNGRSGRAIWLWEKLHCVRSYEAKQAMSLGFLHVFYYDALAARSGAPDV